MTLTLAQPIEYVLPKAVLFIPSRETIEEFQRKGFISNSTYQILLTEIEDVVRLLAPVLQAESTEMLEEEVENKLYQFVLLKTSFTSKLMADTLQKSDDPSKLFTKKKLKKFHRDAYKEGLKFFRSETKKLGKETVRNYLSAFEGYYLFTTNLLDAALSTQTKVPLFPPILTKLPEDAFSKAMMLFAKTDLLLTSAYLALSGEIKNWSSNTLMMIGKNSSEYVLEIEGIILNFHPHYREILTSNLEDYLPLDTAIQDLEK